MKMIDATALNRKSGGAQWRDLRFSGPVLEMFFFLSRSEMLHSLTQQFIPFSKLKTCPFCK